MGRRYYCLNELFTYLEDAHEQEWLRWSLEGAFFWGIFTDADRRRAWEKATGQKLLDPHEFEDRIQWAYDVGKIAGRLEMRDEMEAVVRGYESRREVQ